MVKVAKNGVKLIYGNNGSGKTKYCEEEFNQGGVLLLDSNISGWYNNKLLSHYKYITKNEENRINILSERLVGNESSVTKKSRINKFDLIHEVLKKLNFNTVEEWWRYSNSKDYKINKEIIESNHKSNKYDKKKNISKNWLGLPELISHSSFLETHGEYIANLEKEKKELILLYLRAHTYNSINFEFKEKKTANFHSIISHSIEEIEKELFESEDKLEIDKKDLIEIGPNVWKKIIESEVDKLEGRYRVSDNDIILLKHYILDSEEFKEMKEHLHTKKKKKLQAIVFSLERAREIDENAESSKDGLDITIDLEKEKFSLGEKTKAVLDILLESLHSKWSSNNYKKLVLDDVFETLDIKNQVDAFELLVKASKLMEIEILTHDIKTFETLINIRDNHNYKDIKAFLMNKNGGLQRKEIYPSFYKLSEVILDNIVNNKDYSLTWIDSFVTIFGRYLSKSVSSLGKEKDKILDYSNINYRLWFFSSECVFHYTTKIDLDVIEEVFLLDRKKIIQSMNMEVDTTYIDTLQLLRYLIKSYFKNHEPTKKKLEKMLSISKIRDYLKELRKYIQNEEEYLNRKGIVRCVSVNTISSLNFERATKVYSDYYGSPNKQALRKQRNRLVHSLDQSLISLIL